MTGEPWYPIPPDEPYPNYSGDGDDPDEDEDGEADDDE